MTVKLGNQLAPRSLKEWNELVRGLEAERDEWIAKCADVCQTKDELLYERYDLWEQLETARQVADDRSAWLDVALKALGVKTVFEIPGWKERKANV